MSLPRISSHTKPTSSSSETMTMSTTITAVRLVIARVSVLAAAIVVLAGIIATPSRAQPVDFVKICSLYGAGFFYIPGTDTCTQAQQIVDNQFAIAKAQTLASTGTAMAASLVAPYLPTGTNFAVSTHWAMFNGENAAGFSGLMRLSGNLVFSAGFAVGLDRGSLTTLSSRTQTEFGTSIPQQNWSDLRGLTRAGLMYAW
jgi:Porin subfamily